MKCLKSGCLVQSGECWTCHQKEDCSLTLLPCAKVLTAFWVLSKRKLRHDPRLFSVTGTVAIQEPSDGRGANISLHPPPPIRQEINLGDERYSGW